ncbi:Hsp20/alpha crystallin family protein [Sphaerimonospora mesophila]|uniref:Hsp20/alpha crystallin family protein n=1 Tax=Sphaerimonospora mesophila TaxID=37483 RepID=UPI0009FB794C
MGGLMRRESRGILPEIFDWLEAPFAGLRPLPGQAIRFEDYVQGGRYVLRAELPGIDPEKDVESTLSGGILTVRAERREEQREQHRTEFRYGSFTRSISLPEGADENDVKATVATATGGEHPHRRAIPSPAESGPFGGEDVRLWAGGAGAGRGDESVPS